MRPVPSSALARTGAKNTSHPCPMFRNRREANFATARAAIRAPRDQDQGRPATACRSAGPKGGEIMGPPAFSADQTTRGRIQEKGRDVVTLVRGLPPGVFNEQLQSVSIVIIFVGRHRARHPLQTHLPQVPTSCDPAKLSVQFFYEVNDSRRPGSVDGGLTDLPCDTRN
jgi:hypothetical protein